MMRGYDLIPIGFILILVGVALIVLGAISGVATREAEVRGGGVILIGPFPIVFGSDVQSVKFILILTIVLILIAYYVFSRWSY